MIRRSVALLVVVAAALALMTGCGPRNKIGDRLLGIDSASNARAQVNPQQQPASP